MKITGIFTATGVLFWFSSGVVLLFVLLFYLSLPSLSGMKFEAFKEKAILHLKEKGVNPTWTSIDEIHLVLRMAVITSEDSTFYFHGGINLNAIVDAFNRNVERKKMAFGGSTISQQVVKNLFFSFDKNLVRKLKEAVVTKQIESLLTKDQIFELYLNIAQFGPSVYGVREASLKLFEKTPNIIEPAEAALMASLLPSPTKSFALVAKNESLTDFRQRRIKKILRDMLEIGYVTEEEYRASLGHDFFAEKKMEIKSTILESDSTPLPEVPSAALESDAPSLPEVPSAIPDSLLDDAPEF